MKEYHYQINILNQLNKIEDKIMIHQMMTNNYKLKNKIFRIVEIKFK